MNKASERPLSPHLQVYRPQMTSVMSILHRFCGAALAAGTVFVTWMFLALAMGPGAWAVFTGFCATKIGQFMLAGWAAALSYHLCNGVRHLFWDTGRLFKIENAYRAGWAVLLAAALLTGGLWQHIF